MNDRELHHEFDSAKQLANAIAMRQLSAHEAATMYIERMQRAQSLFNPMTVDRFELALQEARAADDRQARGMPLGPLHGVPITVKECFQVRGLPTTLGLTHQVRRIDSQDGLLVQRLRNAGAILLGKTNVPQLMFCHETSNPVYGQTLNPINPERVAGGSSGGEACAVAAGGSALGLGTDLAGSIRVPCHFCGLTGLKPTSRRLTRQGITGNLRGMESVIFQAGPMARRVEDLELAMRALCPTDSARATLEEPPVPWPEVQLLPRTDQRIGVCEQDGYFDASPAIRRAVREAADHLAQLGCQVVPFRVPDVERAVEIFLQLNSADGAADLRRLLGPSRKTDSLKRIVAAARLPTWSRYPLSAVLRACGQRWWGRLVTTTKRLSADDYWQITDERNQYREQFWHHWDQLKLDAVICPPHALPAFRHGQSADLLPAASYCYWPMLMGMPAGVVPVATVRPDEQVVAERSSRDWIERAAARAEQGSAGLPVGVQVIGRPWREDIVLNVMAMLEQAVGTGRG